MLTIARVINPVWQTPEKLVATIEIDLVNFVSRLAQAHANPAEEWSHKALKQEKPPARGFLPGARIVHQGLTFLHIFDATRARAAKPAFRTSLQLANLH
ncbi:hypothetical protein JCM25156A_15790 [Komagataeibacter kakiaceti JCM 25156]